MEYIERETVSNIIFRYSQVASEPPMDKEDKVVLKTLHEILDEVKQAPAADVEPVRHGKWIGRHGTGGYDDYYCSVCSIYEEGTRNPKFLGKYCSNCGAKMDRGDSNE